MSVEILFWKHYIESDELTRHKMIDTLFGEVDNNFLKDENGFFRYVNATLLQGYFDDLIEYLSDKYKNNSKDEEN